MRFYSRLFAIVSSFFFVLLFLPPRVLAACAENETNIDIACIPNDPAGFVGKFYGIGLGLIGGVAVLFIIIGGYFILTSQGDHMRLASGRSYITYAVIGLLLAIFGYIFISVIVGDILQVPGFASS